MASFCDAKAGGQTWRIRSAILAWLQPQPDRLDAQEDDVGAPIDRGADGRFARSFGADEDVEGFLHEFSSEA
jgi:hypothetical protein